MGRSYEESCGSGRDENQKEAIQEWLAIVDNSLWRIAGSTEDKARKTLRTVLWRHYRVRLRSQQLIKSEEFDDWYSEHRDEIGPLADHPRPTRPYERNGEKIPKRRKNTKGDSGS